MLNVEIDRLKTSATKFDPDNILHFAHATHFHKCFLFNLFYHRVLSVSSNMYSKFIFPNWETLVKRNGQTESKVSESFRKNWEKVGKVCYEYARWLENGLEEEDGNYNELIKLFNQNDIATICGSHCGKNLGIEIMGDTIFLPVQVSNVNLNLVSLQQVVLILTKLIHFLTA